MIATMMKMMTNKSHFISVCIIARPNEDLSNLYNSLDKQTYKNFEIVLHQEIDDFPKLRNRVIAKSKGEIIAFTDSDCYAEPHWLEEINKSFQDASSYLNLNGPQFRIVSSGTYLYDSNSIILNCPQGSYHILIYFSGNINELGISLTSYMGTSMSIILPINITAGTDMTGNYDTRVVKDEFYFNDDLYVYGFLNWDNGTAMAFMEVNVTVRDSIGNILGTALGSTDGSGFFNISMLIGFGWPSDAEIWVSFYPEDNFSSPDYYYVEFFEIELFRTP